MALRRHNYTLRRDGERVALLNAGFVVSDEFRSKVACENDVINLVCHPGQRVAIFSAAFGRTEYESLQCPQPRGVKEESKYSSATILHSTWHLSWSILAVEIIDSFRRAVPEQHSGNFPSTSFTIDNFVLRKKARRTRQMIYRRVTARVPVFSIFYQSVNLSRLLRTSTLSPPSRIERTTTHDSPLSNIYNST